MSENSTSVTYASAGVDVAAGAPAGGPVAGAAR